MPLQAASNVQNIPSRQSDLKNKIEEALREIMENSLDRPFNDLPEDTRRQINEGIEREASIKAEKLFVYLKKEAFDKIDRNESRIEELEERLGQLES